MVRLKPWIGPLALLLALAAPLPFADGWAEAYLPEGWRAQRALAREDWERARALAPEAYLRGYAAFRAGDFEGAVTDFSLCPDAEGAYALGNARMMLGKYDAAIEDYGRALAQRPGWEDAEVNLAIARERAGRIRREGGEGTDGKLGADEVVIEPGKPSSSSGGEETTQGGRETAAETQALWLRRMRVSPGDFLRSRFALQHARERAAPAGGGEAQ